MPETQNIQKESISQKSRSLNECFSFLDTISPLAYEQMAIERLGSLDLALSHPSKKLDIILVGGSSSKNSTILFTSKLLQEEGFKVGTIYANQILSYTERLFINDEPVANKSLNEAMNIAIDAALKNDIMATAFELVIATGLCLFEKEKVDTVLIEVGLGGRLDATAALTPLIYAVTKISHKNTDILGEDLDQVAYETMGCAKPNTWFISAEQSKLRLQKMKVFAEQNNFLWSMPIRKLSALPYIYEQLYGKEASLAERIVQIYVENIKQKFSPFLRGNLLATEKGQRGRPTLEAKRNSELNPLKTIKSFWAQNFGLKRGIFEILEREKPTILLDDSSDIESLSNLFLGLRLLHYKRPIIGACIILGIASEVNAEEVLKLIRYLFKKVSGEAFFIPLQQSNSHSPEKLCNLARTLNVKAMPFKNIKDAFEYGRQIVDERDGLVCFTGATEVISGYWKQIRDIKKI